MIVPNDASGVALPRPMQDGFLASCPTCWAAAPRRLASLDALRGFAMLWLMGGRELSLALVALLYPPLFDAFETQLTHPKWRGFVAWDLVMPVFLFVVGTSLPLAMAKLSADDGSTATAYGRIARRVAVLWLLGVVVQVTKLDMECVEFYSNALQAIAVGYLVTALALLHLRLRGQIGLFVAILLGYGALLMFVPFPDHPGGTLQRTANLPRYIDELLLGDYRRDHSFTWLLTSLGFAASVLLGAMAGHILNGQRTARRKLLALCTIGSGCMAMGWLWSYWLPFNRHLWSSSMVLWAGGIGFLLVALFYAVMDVGGWRRWAFPLVVIGSNALLAYVLDPIYHHAGDTLASCLIVDSTAAHHGLLVSLFEVASLWLMLLFLYRRRVFFRA